MMFRVFSPVTTFSPHDIIAEKGPLCRGIRRQLSQLLTSVASILVHRVKLMLLPASEKTGFFHSVHASNGIQ